MPNSPPSPNASIPSRRFANPSIPSTHADLDWTDALLALLSQITDRCETDLRDSGDLLEDLGQTRNPERNIDNAYFGAAPDIVAAAKAIESQIAQRFKYLAAADEYVRVLQRHRAIGCAILRVESERVLRMVPEAEARGRIRALQDADVDERSVGQVKVYLKLVASRLRLSLSEGQILEVVEGDPHPASGSRER